MPEDNRIEETIQSIKGMKQACLRYLRQMYEMTGRDPSAFVSAEEVGVKLGIPVALVQNIIAYLEDGKYIEAGLAAHYRLTHLGLREVKGAKPLKLDTEKPGRQEKD